MYSLAVLLAVIMLVSAIIYAAPVDPAALSFGQRSDEATIAQKRKELGLDLPLYRQIGRYVNDLSPISLHTNEPSVVSKYDAISLFSFGKKVVLLKFPYLQYSFQTGREVTAILAEAIPKTIILAISAILLASIIGISLGIFAAVKKYTFFDNSAVIGSVLGYSLPSYVTAIFLALIFGYWLGDWTGLNVKGSIIELDDFGEEQYVWKNLLLPAVALGIRPIAIITQLTRSAMLDVLEQDYIRTATAKGLAKAKIVLQHAFRNALNPILTAISGWFAALLAGAFFVENVFSFKGLGDVTVNALLNFDIPVVLGAVVFTASIFVFINLLMDVVYYWIDPKVRIS